MQTLTIQKGDNLEKTNFKDKNELLAYLIKEQGTEVFAFSTDGAPLTKDDVISQLEQSKKNIVDGNGISHDQLDSEASTWD